MKKFRIRSRMVPVEGRGFTMHTYETDVTIDGEPAHNVLSANVDVSNGLTKLTITLIPDELDIAGEVPGLSESDSPPEQ